MVSVASGLGPFGTESRRRLGAATALLLATCCMWKGGNHIVQGKAALGPHPHQGKVKPYKPGVPDIALNKQQQSSLLQGDLVQDLLKGESGGDGGKGGRALAVQDINAPAEYVWDRILDFASYKKMVPKVVESGNYETLTMRNGTEMIKTNLRLNVFGVKIDSYFHHTYYPSLSSMTWTLDYGKKSTLDDSVGFWHVARHPAKEKRDDWSRVYYSVELRIPSWVPGLVIGYLNSKAIREATTWVKRESEEKYCADLAAGRTLISSKKGLPNWGAAFGTRGAGSSTDDSSGPWMPKWMAKPEPVPVVEHEPDKTQKPFRWIRRSVLGISGLFAGLALDGAIAGDRGGFGWCCGGGDHKIDSDSDSDTGSSN